MGCNRESLPSGWDKWQIRRWEAWKLVFSFSQNENYSLKCTFVCKFYVFPWKECIFFWKHSPVWGSGAGISCCLLLNLPNSSTAYFKSFSDSFWMNLVGVLSTPLGDALVGSWWEAVPVPGAQISPGSLHGSGVEGLRCPLAAAEAWSVGWLANGQLRWKEFLFLDDAFFNIFFFFFISVPKSCWYLILLVDDNVKYKAYDSQVCLQLNKKSLLCNRTLLFAAWLVYSMWQPPLLSSDFFSSVFQNEMHFHFQNESTRLFSFPHWFAWSSLLIIWTHQLTIMHTDLSESKTIVNINSVLLQCKRLKEKKKEKKQNLYDQAGVRHCW